MSVLLIGVGTKRKGCVAKLRKLYTSDNGSLTHLYYEIGIEEVREIDESVNRYKGTKDVSVFHGRDIFFTHLQNSLAVLFLEEVGAAYR